MRKAGRRRTEGRQVLVLEGPTLLPAAHARPASDRVGCGDGGANVQVGADLPGVVHGAEVRRTSTGRRAVGTSTPLSLVCGR